MSIAQRPLSMNGLATLAACVLISVAHPTAGQEPRAPTREVLVIKGPPPPVAPSVQTRDDQGQTTVRAVRLQAPLTFDGRLDEAVYLDTPPITGFFQTLPDNGTPATEDTDVWVLFDGDDIYFSARCWQKDIENTLVANDLRRDKARQNDGLGVAFDTFYDRQNGIMFYTNPLGTLGDGYVGEGPGATNTNFNPLWDVRTGRFDGGWTVEMRIPFKTLRYRPGATQIWGMQVRRVIRHRTETAFLTKMPVSGSIGRLSYAATLVGLEAPGGSKNFEIKPYGISRVSTDRTVTPALSKDVDGDFGGDVKYGITKNLTVDFTYNTDFAQVEADDQQVNLTRFNLQIPEKREFFLEGTGNFTFGGGGSGGKTPQLFFSRQIGLNKGRVIPIIVGGRLTGKVGRYSIGALNIEGDDETISSTPKTNFTVLRVKRDILRRSSVGMMYTGRSQSVAAPGRANQAIGIDGAFAFFDDVRLTGYYARTETPTLTGSQESYQATFGYTPDKYGFTIEHLFVGDAFNPEVGFVRRDDIRRTYVSGRLSPRPAGSRRIRQYSFIGSLDSVDNTSGLLETRDAALTFNTEFHSSDEFNLDFTRSYDLLVAPFRIARGVTVPPGSYDTSTVAATYSIGQQKTYTGALSLSYGSFWNGDQTALEFTAGRFALTSHLAVEPNISVNWVDLPYGAFTTQLYRTRLTYTFSPRMYVGGFVQYNSSSDTFSTNVRWRWEYKLGSELFVVYTDDQNTNPSSNTRQSFDLLNRAVVVKVNRLFRF
jgi:hypothetical protein